MNKLLKITVFATLILLASCKQKNEVSKAITKEKSTTSIDYDKQETSKHTEQTVELFLKKLKVAIKNNDSSFIKNSISFPFEYKSGGELVDSYNNYQELKENKEFHTIIKANYTKSCDDEVNKTKHYCITYFDDTIDITFYAIKKENLFQLAKMETPN